jgi:predicted phosphate transport protein (TIGR00153 family)
MAEIKGSIFRRTKAMAGNIDEFLDMVGEAGLAFEKGVHHYLDHGLDEVIEEKLAQISHLEGRADALQRTIETVLHTEMLIPDARGDVLSLLDDLDHLLDSVKSAFLSLTIEHPAIPREYHEAVKELVTVATRAIGSTASASRAYFRDIHAVRDHIHKIAFFEREADRTAIRLTRHIFASDLPLEQKMHLRDCVHGIDALADKAEDVGDHLAIYAVKRSI